MKKTMIKIKYKEYVEPLILCPRSFSKPTMGPLSGVYRNFYIRLFNKIRIRISEE